MKLNILCIGDIVGRPGRRIIADKLRLIVKEHSVDCVIANAENAAGGSGLTRQIYDKLLRYGVNLITLGDHTFLQTCGRQRLCHLQNRQRADRGDRRSDRASFHEARRLPIRCH